MPAKKPMTIAAGGKQRIPADAPIATPPTKLACCMSSIRMPLPWIDVTTKVARVLPVNESKVFATICVLQKGVEA